MFSDEQYRAAGAEITNRKSVWKADVIVSANSLVKIVLMCNVLSIYC